MGLLTFFFGGSDNYSESESSESLDPDLLYPLAKGWLSQAVESDDEVTEYRWEAVEHAEDESGGGFWKWLTGG
jgi:hypothetical protein